MPDVVIADASCLIILSRVGELELLHLLYLINILGQKLFKHKAKFSQFSRRIWAVNRLQ